MANLKLVADAILLRKGDWSKIPDQEKEDCFFIINRYFSKQYPEKSQLLNLKSINKVVAINLWYQFMIDKPYPKSFWSKVDKVDKSDISAADYKSLLIHFNIKDIDLDYIIEKDYEFIKDELKYLKSKEKNK